MLRLAVLCCLVVIASPLLAPANDLRAEFLELETQLMAAAQSKRVEEEKALVSEDFAWSIAFKGRANDVMTRAEWLRGVDHYDLKAFEISQFTAQQFGSITVTNFRMTQAITAGEDVDLSGEYVTTDLWQKGAGKWQLLRRFVSRAVPVPASK